jgi:hypothetical protein
MGRRGHRLIIGCDGSTESAISTLSGVSRLPPCAQEVVQNARTLKLDAFGFETE